MALKDYSTTPSSNDGLGLFDENQAPNTVNDGGRQAMADTRAFYEGIEWRDWGHTPTRTANTTFTVPGDQTAVYTVNRRLKLTDTTTLYGTISASAYTTLTTITVTLDSGALSASLSAVELGLEPSNSPIDKVAKSEKLVDSNGLDVLLTSPTTSAANEITAKAATTGNKPSLNQTGADDVGIDIEGVEVKNGVVTGALAGNASTATNWASASSITLSGPVTGTANINGTTNAAIVTSMAAGSVGRTQLATNAGTDVSTAGGAVNLTLSGAEYGFYPRVWVNNPGASNYSDMYRIAGTVNWETPITNIFIDATTSAGTAFASQRYITASPPYDLGDGEIQLFVFALIDNASGRIIAMFVGPDSVWHYNGPTSIAADFVGRDGKQYQRVKDLSSLPLTLEQALQDPIARQEYFSARRETLYMPREITQVIKNADMNLIPHPFTGNDLTGKTVVMLDPVCDCISELAGLQDDGDNVNKLFHDGFLIIGNQMLQRSGPAGLLIPSVKWKNTRQ